MKFPRRARLLRNPFDATAYAAVFFLLVIFVSLGTRLYTPGVKISLPATDEQPGTDQPSVKVAMDESGRYFFENQIIEEDALKNRLRTKAKESPEPLTLVILMDQAVRFENVLRLQSLARNAGIPETIVATRSSAAPIRP